MGSGDMSGFRRRLMMITKKMDLPYIEVAGLKWDVANLTGGDVLISDNGNDYYTQRGAVSTIAGIARKRLPTEDEMKSLIDSGYVFTRATLPDYGYGTFGGLLKLSAAGMMELGSSHVGIKGTDGLYWTSTSRAGNITRYLHLWATDAAVGGFDPENGLSVRCIIE